MNLNLSVTILLMAALVAAFFWGNGKAGELKKVIQERQSLVYMLDEAETDYELLDKQRKTEVATLSNQLAAQRKLAENYAKLSKTLPKTDCFNQRVNPSVAEWLCKQKNNNGDKNKDCDTAEKPP